jgi:hypothetical protein
MPTSMLVAIVIILILLGIALYTIFSASGLTIPLFSEIDKILKSFMLPGSG